MKMVYCRIYYMDAGKKFFLCILFARTGVISIIVVWVALWSKRVLSNHHGSSAHVNDAAFSWCDVIDGRMLVHGRVLEIADA